MVQVEEIKRRVSIEDILAERGIHLRKGRCACPLHEGDNPTSFSVRNGFFKCFSCYQSGDVISLTQKLYHLEFREAVEYLAKKAGISDIDFDKPVTQKIKPRQIDWDEHFARQENEILNLLIRLWERVLRRLEHDLRNGRISLAQYYADQQYAEYQLARLDEESIMRNYENKRRRNGKKTNG